MRGLPTSKLINAERDESMSLTRVERERVADSRRRIQSASEVLNHVDPAKVPHLEEIQECLEDAEKSLTGALRADHEK